MQSISPSDFGADEAIVVVSDWAREIFEWGLASLWAAGIFVGIMLLASH